MSSFIRNTTTTSSNGRSNNNSSTSKNKASVHYQIFKYQEKLRHPNKNGQAAQALSIAKSKISLTESLIYENVKNLHDRSDEDLRIICREMSFKNQLKKQVSHYSKLVKMVKNAKKNLEKISTTISTKPSC